MKFPKKVITLTDLWVFSSEKSSDFYLSSWQKGESPVPMLIVRLVLAGISSGIFAWSLYSGASWYWLVFLTNWGILFVFLMTISGLSVSIMSARKKLSDASEEDVNFWLDLSTHGFNSCIVFIELMVSRTPLRFVHIYQPLTNRKPIHLFSPELARTGSMYDFSRCLSGWCIRCVYISMATNYIQRQSISSTDKNNKFRFAFHATRSAF
ncbi:unnamed protein product [Leptidea sinapis]|uniref:Uncharacterized protein n=1 Tax=Leptidea sinapis TaxID=189913 RepID=A0A5E4QX72_9NEOP|nr:unnamed protein product [Leptidea sinapis]